MKVLSVITNLNPKNGGPPEVLKNHTYTINKKKKIMSTLCSDILSYKYLIKCIFLSSFRKKIYNFFLKYDVIHFHEVWSLKNIFIIFFIKKIHCKYLYIMHGHFDEWSLNQNYFKKKLFIKLFLKSAFKYANGFFFLNHDEYKDARKSFDFKNVFIIPNGVDLKKFKKIDDSNNKRKKIVFFGRIHKKKGIELLIDAIKLLPNSFFENFHFEICGPGEKKYLNFIKEKINDISLNKVAYKDFVSGEKKINYLSNANIFVLPSFEEGDSIALKEALSLSIPVIISRQCRMDVVKEYNSGLIINSNTKDLYKSLLEISNKDLPLMGKNSRKLMEDKFSIYDISERVLQIYKDIHCGSKTSRDWIQ